MQVDLGYMMHAGNKFMKEVRAMMEEERLQLSKLVCPDTCPYLVEHRLASYIVQMPMPILS